MMLTDKLNNVPQPFPYLLGVDIENEHPNILVATSKQVTATEQKTIIIFKGAKSLKGKQVEFSADEGTVDGENSVTKTVPANGELTIEYIPPSDPGIRIVTARIKGSTVGVQTFVYVAEYDFLDLTNNQGMDEYNDTTFTQSNAMTQAQIQELLDYFGRNYSEGEHYATYQDGGKPASQIIKEAADAKGVNPRIILAVLQRENKGVLSKLDDVSDAEDAMGVIGVSGFTNEVYAGTQTLINRYNEPIATFNILHPSRQKAEKEGKRKQYLSKNHIYSVPNVNINTMVAVTFKPKNKSSNAQHIYNNYITHRKDISIQLPAGGVYLFIKLWRDLFEQVRVDIEEPRPSEKIQGGESYQFKSEAYSIHTPITYQWVFEQRKPESLQLGIATGQNPTVTLNNNSIWEYSRVRATLTVTDSKGYIINVNRDFNVRINE